MSIEHWAGGLESRRVKASRCEFDDGGYLIVGQMKPLRDFADRRACFQIVKDHGNRRPRIPEHPGAAAFTRDAFDHGAL